MGVLDGDDRTQPSDTLVLEMRGICGELNSSTYSDDYLRMKLRKHPLLDANGQEPIVYDSYAYVAGPQKRLPNPYWEPTFDLHAAAAEIWEEKAAHTAREFDYSDAGLQQSRTQRYDHFMAQARFHRSRRAAGAIRQQPFTTASEELDYLRDNRAN